MAERYSCAKAFCRVVFLPGYFRYIQSYNPSFLANVNSHVSYITVARSSVCRLSVTLVRRTQEVEIFGNVSTQFGTVAIR